MNASLNETLGLHNMITVARAVFFEDHKYHPDVFLDECLYNF